MSTPTLFERIENETPGYAAAAVGSLDGSWFEAHHRGNFDLESVREPLLQMARASAAAWEGLGGAVDFGSNDEVLYSASRGFLLLRLDHGSRRFLAVMLHSSGNIGYLRLNMRAWLRQIGKGA